ncbi:MAG: membrane associated rhomboid family serine protease [Gammaproteobacteria bacterium]|jgi:membrane associated rhomboid family serine protease
MTALYRNVRPVFILVVIMWLIEAVSWSSGHALVRFGIEPRTPSGLIGIFTAPFLHGSLVHMASNTIPMLVLGALVAVSGAGRLVGVTIVTAVIGGLGVWAFGRAAMHVGASILIFGYFGFLVANAYYERSAQAIIFALLTLGLYAGLIWGVLPTQAGVSWEGHLFGFIGGVISARIKRPRRRR